MYPKTFTHRHDPHASVVVMSAEQEAELPEEFRAPLIGASLGRALPAAPEITPAEALLLLPEYADFIADRDQLAVDRANLTAGYKADKALVDAERDLLSAQRAQLDEERAQFEQKKAAALLDVPTAPTVDLAADAQPSSVAEPSKRTRAARE